jgi:hypothetical protein
MLATRVWRNRLPDGGAGEAGLVERHVRERFIPLRQLGGQSVGDRPEELPAPALRELEMAILRQDPPLELPSADRARTGPLGSPRSWLPRERRTATVAALDVAPSTNPNADAEAVGRLGADCARVAAEVI